ncbi:hypothetical protein L596_007111 [Steinernema carpocapsae]|uniref:Uncharacterized protein n=1 Tax=Steinernema carpocapsae TaxID=34508 RepID=A0A4U5P9A9_STECR|nr:hypothetical protein L596_007111 [Steinernema carpocapsae]
MLSLPRFKLATNRLVLPSPSTILSRNVENVLGNSEARNPEDLHAERDPTGLILIPSGLHVPRLPRLIPVIRNRFHEAKSARRRSVAWRSRASPGNWRLS